MTAVRLLMLFAITLPATSAVAHSTLSDITDEGAEKVTLPVIPQSRLLIHDTSGIDVSTPDGPVQSLPVAVFLTRKSPDEVVAWYRETLPDYTVLSDDSGRHIQILERAGEDSRVDSPDTYRIPNIRIRPADARMATHMKGARTMLQVYYTPAAPPEKPAGDDS